MSATVTNLDEYRRRRQLQRLALLAGAVLVAWWIYRSSSTPEVPT